MRRRYGRKHYTYRGRRRRRTRIQLRRITETWMVAAAAALIALAAAAFWFFSPGSGRPGFEKGELLVCVNGDGTVGLSWPKASGASVYQLETDCGGENSQRYCSRPSAQISGVTAGGTSLSVRVRAVSDRTNFLGKTVLSHKTLKAELEIPENLTAPVLTGSAGEGTADLSWTGGDGELYQVFAMGEHGETPLASTQEQSLSVPLKSGQSLRFTVRAGWERSGYILCGPASAVVTVSEQHLPGTGPLSLRYEESGHRMYTLAWNGTQCDHFEVQRLQGDEWVTLSRMAPAGQMVYATGRLRSGSYNRYRVVAGENGAAEEVSFFAAVSTLYARVWPIQDLKLRENPGGGDTLAAIPGGTTLCVLAEEGDWFRVRFGEEYGWVDSRFCMINLPEYVGDYCDYDIANSYQSLFAAHDAPIRQVTDQVISGFEHVRTADGTFLVPYLYPCAKKLLTAAQNARSDGFQLKIYEAFRPQQATRFLYDTTSKQLNAPALARTEDGRAYEPQTGRLVDLSTGATSSETVAQPRSGTITLSRLMTDNGRFHLGSFLAKSISAHNRGIALDLTLETLEDREELEMQSAIHDLSWYAATDRNNLNARLLAGYMKGVGMDGLSSEWWHFQDDDTRSAIKLNTYLYTGVSSEGWVQDDAGWRYRDADGVFVQNRALTINGKEYTFDSSGYAA